MCKAHLKTKFKYVLTYVITCAQYSNSAWFLDGRTSIFVCRDNSKFLDTTVLCRAIMRQDKHIILFILLRDVIIIIDH